MSKKVKNTILVLCIIIIAGIIVTIIGGFNKGIEYSDLQQVKIYIAQDVDLKEMREITDTVFGNEKVIIQKVELFNDEVAITAKEINSEQLESLVQITNEKYGLSNTASSLDVITLPGYKIWDTVSPYIMPTCIVIVITLIYIAIRFRKNGLVNAICTSLISVVLVEGTIFAIIALVRIPFGEFVMPVALFVLISTLTIVQYKLEEKLLK